MVIIKGFGANQRIIVKGFGVGIVEAIIIKMVHAISLVRRVVNLTSR